MERNAKGQFNPGSGGRQPGARNKLQANVIDVLAKDFKEHGADVVQIVRVEKPAEYLRIVASILPKEVLLTDSGLEDLTDDELRDALAWVRSCKRADAVPTSTEH